MARFRPDFNLIEKIHTCRTATFSGAVYDKLSATFSVVYHMLSATFSGVYHKLSATFSGVYHRLSALDWFCSKFL